MKRDLFENLTLISIYHVCYCIQEYKACNLDACAEVRRTTPWTPWYPVNVTQMGARQEQRVRYTCRALLADPHDLQLGKRKIETRLCPTTDGAAVCETDGTHTHTHSLRHIYSYLHIPLIR